MAQRLWRSKPGLQTPSSGPSSHHKHWTRSQQAWTWVSGLMKGSFNSKNKYHLPQTLVSLTSVPGSLVPPPDLPSHNFMPSSERVQVRRVCGPPQRLLLDCQRKRKP